MCYQLLHAIYLNYFYPVVSILNFTVIHIVLLYLFVLTYKSGETIHNDSMYEDSKNYPKLEKRKKQVNRCRRRITKTTPTRLHNQCTKTRPQPMQIEPPIPPRSVTLPSLRTPKCRPHTPTEAAYKKKKKKNTYINHKTACN